MNVQGRVTEGDTSQMVDFHVWDVVAVEDLRDFIAEGMSSSWALLICVCVCVFLIYHIPVRLGFRIPKDGN